jgi:hypothetical protein
VKLKASNAFTSDSVKVNVSINPEETWEISGVLSLDTQQKDVKNFTSVEELMQLTARSTVTGDITVNVRAGEMFDVLLTESTVEWLSSVKDKLEQTNHTLSLVKAGTGDKPIINFTGMPSYIRLIVDLSKHLQLDNVEIRILGQPVDLTKINENTVQRICSGDSSASVNFGEIGASFTFVWSLINTPVSTGCLQEGTTVIPAMTLTNNSLTADTLKYKISIRLLDVQLYDFTYQIIVLPALQGDLTTISPTNGTTLNSPSVSFSWSRIENAVYDLYLWKSGEDESEAPFAININAESYYNTTFCRYGESYSWKITARNECNEIISNVSSFAIRDLPDLKVSTIVVPENVEVNKKYMISYTLENVGKADLSGNSWYDQIVVSYSPDISTNNYTVLETIYRNDVIPADSSITYEFEVTAPNDTLQAIYYQVITDVYNYITEQDENNNRTSSTAVFINSGKIDDTDYALLRLVYNALDGNNWNNSWNIQSNKTGGNNWQGVRFEDGKVISINLSNNKLKGNIPSALFAFTQLTGIDLSNNGLTGNLHSIVDSLQLCENEILINSLNLSGNHFEGDVYPLASALPALVALNLSYNKLTRVSNPLSSAITNLNLNYQQLPADTMIVSSVPAFELPEICRYNHSNRSYTSYPSVYVSDNNSSVGYFYYQDLDYHLYWYPIYYIDGKETYIGWNYPSGTPFVATVESGTARGSTIPLLFNYPAGDASADAEVSILDVQQTLNYLFGENPEPFNFVAADTYKDTLITVQDIVVTINILLSTDPELRASFESEPANLLSIEDGKLVLYSEQAVAALDITLQGTSDTEISFVLDDTKFQYLSRNSTEGTRLIIFSLAKDIIPQGSTTVIAELDKKDAILVNAVLSSPEAKRLPVKLLSPTGTGGVSTDTDAIKVFAKEGRIYYSLPEKAENVTAFLYTAQGIIVGKQETNNVPAGKHNLNFNVNHPNVYILNLIVKKEGQNISKYMKLIF